MRVLQMTSPDGTNRLAKEFVLVLAEVISSLGNKTAPLVISGNHKFFSAGADLREIVALKGPSAYEFARMGQNLMEEVSHFPAPTYAAITGYCMGGGLDLALACRYRVASPHTVFGHRGAALGLITGWGGTQRLPRLLGKGRAVEMLVAAEKLTATRAFDIGLVDAISENPVAECVRRILASAKVRE